MCFHIAQNFQCLLLKKLGQFHSFQILFMVLCLIVINKLEHCLNFCNKDNGNNIYTIKLVQCVTQCTPSRKGTCFSLNYTITLVFEPQNVVTPSTPKHISFKAKLDSKIPPYKSKNPQLLLSNCHHGNLQQLLTMSKELGIVSTLPQRTHGHKSMIDYQWWSLHHKI